MENHGAFRHASMNDRHCPSGRQLRVRQFCNWAMRMARGSRTAARRPRSGRPTGWSPAHGRVVRHALLTTTAAAAWSIVAAAQLGEDLAMVQLHRRTLAALAVSTLATPAIVSRAEARAPSRAVTDAIAGFAKLPGA